MHRNFGPWATSLSDGTQAHLSAFWKRRLTLLSNGSPISGKSSRPMLVGCGLLSLLTILLPAVRSVAVQDEPPQTTLAVQKASDSTSDAASPTSGTATPAAAELMQRIYDDESWPARVNSLLLRMETVQERTDLGVKPQKMIPSPFQQSDKPLVRRHDFRKLLAWDRERVTTVHEIVGYNTDRRTFSNGLAIEEHARLARDGEPARQSFVLDNKVDLIFQHSFDHLLRWGQVGRHLGPLTWWRKPYESDDGGKSYRETADIPRREGLRYLGIEMFHGQLCHVVEWPVGHDQFFIRTSDYRLRGERRFSYRASSTEDLQLKQQIAGRKLETINDWDAWLASLPPDAQVAARGKYEAEVRQRRLMHAEELFDDYREVAPECWFPFHQQLCAFITESGKPELEVTVTTRVVELVVDPQLDDSLFEHNIPEGGDIQTDWRYDPPIRYNYRADLTEEERQTLAATARAEREKSKKVFEEIQAGVDVRLGQNPPALPRDGWINSPPLDWQSLRGKAVQVVFWDIGCGPCHYTLDLVQHCLPDAKSRGQAFIAVHRATKDRAAVEKELAKHKWTMPVLIDSDGKDPAAPSLYDWLHIQGMPWVVLVNREGEIVAHDNGSFGSGIFAKFGELWRTGEIRQPAPTKP